MIDVKQIYETELFHESGLGFRAITVPSRSLSRMAGTRDPRYVSDLLEINILGEIRAGWTQRALVSVLAEESSEEIHQWIGGVNGEIAIGPLARRPELYELAEYVLTAPVIPFENSPLSAKSLGVLLTKAGGYGVGAYMGFLVSAGTPLIFITVPAGMIICGAAAGVARGLEEGLRLRIKRLITGH